MDFINKMSKRTKKKNSQWKKWKRCSYWSTIAIRRNKKIKSIWCNVKPSSRELFDCSRENDERKKGKDRERKKKPKFSNSVVTINDLYSLSHRYILWFSQNKFIESDDCRKIRISSALSLCRCLPLLPCRSHFGNTEYFVDWN